jgi:hypothetical protein
LFLEENEYSAAEKKIVLKSIARLQALRLPVR